jgi:hypothetical protein
MKEVNGDKCVDVSTVRRRVQQFRSQGCSMPVVSGESKILFLRAEFKSLLNNGKSVLKVEKITWKSDYAQL